MYPNQLGLPTIQRNLSPSLAVEWVRVSLEALCKAFSIGDEFGEVWDQAGASWSVIDKAIDIAVEHDGTEDTERSDMDDLQLLGECKIVFGEGIGEIALELCEP